MDSIAVCKTCGARNRIKPREDGKRPVCGKCGASLPKTSVMPRRVVEVSDLNFDAEVLSFPGTVVVQAWAPWCGACRQAAPVLSGFAREYGGRIKVVRINVDKNRRFASRYQVLSLPTLLFFKNGRLVNTVAGAVPRSEIERKLYAIR